MAVGTPDYQYGVVSSQALIGTLAAGVGTDTVDVPPNAESLIVVTPGATAGIFVTVIGATSGLSYPGAKMTSAVSGANSSTFAFDASSALDAQVTVSIEPVPGARSYVYADAGVHQVVELSKLSDARGVQFVGPVIPGITSNAHPPDELSFVSAVKSATGGMLGSPGAGKRYRIFTAQVIPQASGVFGHISDSVAGVAIVGGGNNIGGQLPFIPQGIPLSTGAGINYVLESGAGNVLAVVVYTTETQ